MQTEVFSEIFAAGVIVNVAGEQQTIQLHKADAAKVMEAIDHPRKPYVISTADGRIWGVIYDHASVFFCGEDAEVIVDDVMALQQELLLASEMGLVQ